MQRSLHRFISMTAEDSRKLRKEGKESRRGSQSRVYIEPDKDTIDPVQQYAHSLLGEVKMGLLDAVAIRTEIFRQSTEENTPITSSESTPIPSSISTPNLSALSSPNLSRRPSVLGGGRRLSSNNENGAASPFSSPNGSRRNSLTDVGLEINTSGIVSAPRTPQSQSRSTTSSRCSTPISNATSSSSLSQQPSMFFSPRTLETFLDNCTDIDSLNPLHHAAKGGHLSIVKHLAGDCKLDVNKTTNNGNTAIHFAAEEGYIFVIEYLFNVHHALMDCVNDEGWAPLHLACFWGHYLIVEFLVISQKVDINRHKGNTSGRTPLILAVYSDHLSVVNILVVHGADVDRVDKEGKSPLWWACFMGHMTIIEYLVAAGANHLQADRDGNTPLHAACMKGNMPVITFLVHRYNSVDHNMRNVAGQKAVELMENEEAKNHVIFEMVEISMQMNFPVHTTSSMDKKTSVDQGTVVEKATVV